MNNVLIVKFGALGDVIRTSYILPGFHKKYNKSKVFWLTSESAYDLLRFNPFVDYLCTPQHGFDFLINVDFDLVVSLDDEMHILELVKKVNAKVTFGAYADNNNIKYTDDSALWFDMGLISRLGKTKADQLKKQNKLEHNQIFSNMLNIEINNPCFYNSYVLTQKIGRRIDSDFYNVGINAGAGGRWPSKQLPEKEVITLIRKISSIKVGKKQIKVHLLGGKDEEKMNQRVLRNFSDHVQYLTKGCSILEFAAIIGSLDYVITSDSMALHLAISQQTNNLSFYAPTSADEIGTFGSGVKLKSLSPDYCSYDGLCNNTTITSDRIFNVMTRHLKQMGYSVEQINGD